MVWSLVMLIAVALPATTASSFAARYSPKANAPLERAARDESKVGKPVRIPNANLLSTKAPSSRSSADCLTKLAAAGGEAPTEAYTPISRRSQAFIDAIKAKFAEIIES